MTATGAMTLYSRREEGVRTLPDGGGYLLHLGRAGVLRPDVEDQDDRVDESDCCPAGSEQAISQYPSQLVYLAPAGIWNRL